MLYSENKRATYHALEVGQKIDGYEMGNNIHFGDWTVVDVNPSYVSVKQKFGNKVTQVPSDVIFFIKLTEDEFEQKYLEGAKEVYRNIQNRLAEYEIGDHEIWNAWLGTPYEMAQQCDRGDFKIIGYCKDIIPKHSWITEEPLDVAICAEYENGERFWCHWRMEYLKEMIEVYRGELSGANE